MPGKRRRSRGSALSNGASDTAPSAPLPFNEASPRSPGHLDPSASSRALSALLSSLPSRNITLSPLITPQVIPAHGGLGIVINSPIRPPSSSSRREVELLHVPVSGLLKPSDVPLSFIPTSTALPGRKGWVAIRNHARIAAFLAFGPADALSGYRSWTATWPRRESLAAGMPLCWPESALGHLPADAAAALGRQRAKYDADVAAVAAVLEVPGLRERRGDGYSRWLWAWLCVNTRCFYYTPPPPPVNPSSTANGTAKRKRKDQRRGASRGPQSGDIDDDDDERAHQDTDENLALCPLIDIFNHAAPLPSATCPDLTCTVECDTYDGFRVKTPASASATYAPGSELFTSYGAHTNDVLWVEYGFLLDANRWDSISLPDAVVLRGLGQPDRDVLETNGYLGTYTVHAHHGGVCWRTEAVAYLGVLKLEDWEGLIGGTYAVETDAEDDPGEDPALNDLAGSGSVDVILHPETPKRQAMRRIYRWVLEVRDEAEARIAVLGGMSADDIKAVFADSESEESNSRDGPGNPSPAGEESVPEQRHATTLQRWKQMWSICTSGLQTIETDCPGTATSARKVDP